MQGRDFPDSIRANERLAHSVGAVAPEMGSLYRVLSQLVDEGWVKAEARRLAHVAVLARERDLLPEADT